jgi:hypothetical protein
LTDTDEVYNYYCIYFINLSLSLSLSHYLNSLACTHTHMHTSHAYSYLDMLILEWGNDVLFCCQCSEGLFEIAKILVNQHIRQGLGLNQLVKVKKYK